MSVVDRIVSHADHLTTTERKIAAVLADEPQVVAFGTVAQVAQRSGASGPSVVRLATKLGYDGFVGLQADVQAEMSHKLLGPARDRIRQELPDDLISRIVAAEADNVDQTLHNLDRDGIDRAAVAIANLDRHVWIYPGGLTAAVGSALATLISQLRPRVTLLGGSDLAVGRSFADMEPGDVVVAIDIHRYEKALLSAVAWAAEHGAAIIALTDGPLSPLAGLAQEKFFFAARGVGPFDSMVGGVALANVLVGAVAALLRQSATSRLDAIEAAWSDWHVVVAEPAPAEGAPAEGAPPPAGAPLSGAPAGETPSGAAGTASAP